MFLFISQVNATAVNYIHSCYITLSHIKVQNVKCEDTLNKCHIMVDKSKDVNLTLLPAGAAQMHNK